MDNSIAEKLRLALMSIAPGQQPAVPPAVPFQPGLPQPVPFDGSMRREKSMARYVATTPEQDAATMAWEQSDTNRGELERALRNARHPFERSALAEEYGKLFGPFDPQGDGYDYESAVAAGIRPDKTGHWGGRVPDSGMILKGAGHRTFDLTRQAEQQSGFNMRRDIEDGRYYSNPPLRGKQP